MEGSVTLRSAVRTYRFQTLGAQKANVIVFFWPLALKSVHGNFTLLLAKNIITQTIFETFVCISNQEPPACILLYFCTKVCWKATATKSQPSFNVSTNHSKGQFKTVFWLHSWKFCSISWVWQRYDNVQAKSLQQ